MLLHLSKKLIAGKIIVLCFSYFISINNPKIRSIKIYCSLSYDVHFHFLFDLSVAQLTFYKLNLI